MYSNSESSNYLYPYFFQIASIVTLPFDVVKTRRQVELGELQAKNCNIDINFIILTLLIIQLSHQPLTSESYSVLFSVSGLILRNEEDSSLSKNWNFTHLLLTPMLIFQLYIIYYYFSFIEGKNSTTLGLFLHTIVSQRQ